MEDSFSVKGFSNKPSAYFMCAMLSLEEAEIICTTHTCMCTHAPGIKRHDRLKSQAKSTFT